MRLIGKVIDVKELTEQQIRQMFDVFSGYFENIDHGRFINDMREKQWAIILSDPGSGEIKGFSTMMLMRETIDGRNIEVLFSGDTIVDKEYWGSTELAHLGGKILLSFMQKINRPELYWMLITKGYRTYHFLPLFFNEFYPRYDKPTPDRVKKIMDVFAGRKYPANYSPEKGIVSFNGQKEYLKKGIGDIHDQKLNNPHIKFFCTKNPLYDIGDELVCLAPVTSENFKPVAYRMIYKEKRDV